MVEGDLGDEFAEKVTLEGTITYPTKLEKEYHWLKNADWKGICDRFAQGN